MKIETKMKALRQQAGYTLIELSISVAIIAVLVMTGLYGVPRILDTNKVTTNTQQITLATANYSKLAAMTSGTNDWATTPLYASATALTLGAMGAWAEENILRNGTSVAYGLQHVFGGSIYSRNATTGIAGFIGPNQGYILKLQGIPARSCFAVATAFANTAVQIEIDSSATPTAGPITAEPLSSTVPVKSAGGALAPATLATQCQTLPTVAKTVYLWFAY